MINKKLLVVCLTPFVLGMNLSFSAESTANAGEQVSQVPTNTQGNENQTSQQSANGPGDGQTQQNAQAGPDQGDLIDALFNTNIQTQDNRETADPHENISQNLSGGNTDVPQTENTVPVAEQAQIVPDQGQVVTQPAETVVPQPVVESTVTPQTENTVPVAEQPQIVPDQGQVVTQPAETVVPQTPIVENTVTPQTENTVPVAEQPQIVPDQGQVVTQPAETVVPQPVVESTVTPQTENTVPATEQGQDVVQSDIEKAGEHIKTEAEEIIDKKEITDVELKNKVEEVDANIDETAKKVDDISSQVSETNDQINDFVLMLDARLGKIEKSINSLSSDKIEQPIIPSDEERKNEENIAIASPVDKIDAQKETVSAPNAASTELTSSKEITKDGPKVGDSEQQIGQESKLAVNSEIKENSEKVLTKEGTDEKVVSPETKQETVSKDSLTEEKAVEIIQKNEDDLSKASKRSEEFNASISPSESKVLTPEAGKLETKQEIESMNSNQELDPSLLAYIDKRVQESVNENSLSLQKEKNLSVVVPSEGNVAESSVKNEIKSSTVIPDTVPSEESSFIEEKIRETPTQTDETGELKKADSEVVKANEESPERTILPENDNEKAMSISSEEKQKVEDPETVKIDSTKNVKEPSTQFNITEKSVEEKNEGELKTPEENSTEQIRMSDNKIVKEEDSTQSNITEKSVEEKNEGELKTSEKNSTEQIGSSDNGIKKEESVTKSSNSEELEANGKVPSEESTADLQVKASDELKSETNDAKEDADSNEKKSVEETVSVEHTENVKVADDSDATIKSENTSTEESLKVSETKDEGAIDEKKSITEETVSESKIADEKEPLVVQNEKLISSSSETTKMLKNTINQLKNIREAIEALNSPVA